MLEIISVRFDRVESGRYRVCADYGVIQKEGTTVVADTLCEGIELCMKHALEAVERRECLLNQI